MNKIRGQEQQAIKKLKVLHFCIYQLQIVLSNNNQDYNNEYRSYPATMKILGWNFHIEFRKTHSPDLEKKKERKNYY